jgi:acyl-[acyl-carrier-protein]-phospholipid O-acyltransferase/long-chain-fatty-acid--[acyl-carrier-protein] ligase
MRRSTYDYFFQKLGVRLFEGYGVTEGAPILAINTLMNNRLGSVGKIIPGIKWKIEPIKGLDGPAGRFMVKGPNMMLGYLNPDLPNSIQLLGDEWYNTGDIVEVDSDGFLWIRGRFKRFAKLSGEMVSLSAIEEVAMALWPETPLSVLSLVDPNRGERLVLVHEGEKPEMDKLRQALHDHGLTDLFWPKLTLSIDKIPITPLGKVDIPTLTTQSQDLVEEINRQGQNFFGGQSGN